MPNTQQPQDRLPEHRRPEDQRPGHHPDHEQDKPDLDAMAARLGVVSDTDEPAGAPRVEPDVVETGRMAAERDRTRIRVGLILLGAAVGYAVARATVRALRSR